jgi:F-type H+-transporting ATPase subunit b
MSEPKKGFVGSTAFYLVIAWVVLGVVLHLAFVYKIAPVMNDACARWDGAVADPAEITAHFAHLKEGGHVTACKLAEEKIEVSIDLAHEKDLESKKEGLTEAHAPEPVTQKPVLIVAFNPITRDPKATAWAVPNFLILITVLWYFVSGPLNEMFRSRRQELKTAIDAAESARQEAEARYTEYQRRLAKLDEELAAIRAEFKAEAEAEKTKMLAEADKQAQRIKTEAGFTAKQELLMAQYRLREEAARLAVEVAEKVIREVIDDSDRDRLLNEYLTKIMEH